MNSQQLWSSLRKKPRWPNPEDSIGQFYGERQGRLCWSARGPAHEVFSNVAPAIKEYLNNCSDAVPGDDWVTWSIYMIGRSKSTAVPTIMFESFQKDVRKETMNMVRKSGLLSEYPGIETGHWSFPPNIVFPQQLGLTSPQSNATSSPSDRPLGPQVTVRTASNDLVEHRKATVGGLFRLRGKNYYFTANHPFSSGFRDVSWPSSLADLDDECEFGDESDAGGDEDAESLTELTSRGSRTPDSFPDYDSDAEANSGSLDTLHSTLDSEEASNIFPESSGKMRGTEHETVSEGTALHRLSAKQPNNVDTRQGAADKGDADSAIVSEQDLCITSSELDYALIRSADDSLAMSIGQDVLVPFSQGIPFFSLDNVEENITESAPIVTWTGSSGYIAGNISGPPSYTRLPGAMSYQKVFTVQLDEPLFPGDCGSCVFNAITGTIYGHIVAGSSVTHSAYIMPATVVFRDIAFQIDKIDQSVQSPNAYSSYSFGFEKLAMRADLLKPLPTRQANVPALQRRLKPPSTSEPRILFMVPNPPHSLRSRAVRGDYHKGSLVDSKKPEKPQRKSLVVPNATSSSKSSQVLVIPKDPVPIISKDPVIRNSRAINNEEAWAAHHFESHALKCAYCRNPYEAYRCHEQLCEVGHRLAQDVASFMYRTDDKVYSTLEGGNRSEIEIPLGYVQVGSLLKAIERSLRHRSRVPFVSMDRTYYTAGPQPSKALSDVRKSPKAGSRPRKGEIVDWPSSPVPATAAVETKPSNGRSLYEQDIESQRRNAKTYNVEIREPSPRDGREHRLSGYYR